MHQTERRQLIFACLLGSTILALGGSIYRSLHPHVQGSGSIVGVELGSVVPLTIGGWQGSDVEIEELMEADFFADQALIRRYWDADRVRYMDLYIAFSARPGRMLGHRPEVCYKAGGWVLEEADKLYINLPDGGVLPCTASLFRQPLNGKGLTVLSFYIFDGNVCTSEESFSGLRWRKRRDGPVSDSSVTQIQISAPYRSVAIEGVQQLGDVLLEAFDAG